MRLTCSKTEKMKYVVAVSGVLKGMGFMPASDVDLRKPGVVMAFYEATIYDELSDVPQTIAINAIHTSDGQIGNACTNALTFHEFCMSKVQELVKKFEPVEQAA